MQMESGDKYRRRSSEKRIGVFTDSGNAGYLGGSGARLPPLCGARIEAIVGNDLSLRATAEDIKRHVVVKAKKRRQFHSSDELEYMYRDTAFTWWVT